MNKPKTLVELLEGKVQLSLINQAFDDPPRESAVERRKRFRVIEGKEPNR
jgi:hypothetical protein